MVYFLSHVWLLQPHGLWPARLLCPWVFPGKETEVGCHFILQRIFPTQVSNLGLLHCRRILYQLSCQAGHSQFTHLYNGFSVGWSLSIFSHHHSLGLLKLAVQDSRPWPGALGRLFQCVPLQPAASPLTQREHWENSLSRTLSSKGWELRLYTQTGSWIHLPAA